MSATGDPPSPDSGIDGDVTGSHQASLIVCAVTTWVIAALFVALRFYTRRWLIHVLGAEDWTILGAVLFSALTNGFIITEVGYGFGRHISTFDFSKPGFMEMSKLAWFDMLWYNITMLLTKLSILLLYRRVLKYQHARYAMYAIMLVVILSYIFIFSVTLTACIPLKAWWDYTMAPEASYCHPRSFWWACVGLHMSTDFLIFALPIPIIFSLRVHRRQKMVLYGIFTFGFLVTIMSVVRLIYLCRQYIVPDFTYDNAELTYWTCIEVNTAIVCSCVMTLKPLINRIIPDFLLSSPTSGEMHHRSPTNGGGPNQPPLTIGSTPLRKDGQVGRHPSWVTFQNDDETRLTVDSEEGLELISRTRTMETGLRRKIGSPNRPVTAQHRCESARLPLVAIQQQGLAVRPTSVRWYSA